VGTLRDLRAAVERGVDMFDCVLPTRLARHNVAIREDANLNMLNARFKTDFAPLDENCACLACREFTRAYVHHLCKCKEISGARLLTIHNLHTYMELMRELRREILS